MDLEFDFDLDPEINAENFFRSHNAEDIAETQKQLKNVIQKNALQLKAIINNKF